MDVVALAQQGIPYTVATLGTATTSVHVERLFRVVNDLVFCFDGDRAGRAAGWRALEVALPFLSAGRQVSFLFLPEGEDPDTLVRREGQAAFEHRLTQATPLADYLFAELRRQTDPDTLAGRARLAEQARPLLEKLPEGPFRELLVERLRQEAGLTTTRLRSPPVMAASRADRNLRLTRTPLRKVIALLLYRPELAQQVTISPTNSEPGVKLLAELIETLRRHPQLRVATLLERYRDTREGAILEQLAAWEPEATEQDYQFEAEFADILAYLRRRDDPRERLPDMLLQRGLPSALSPEERETVRNLSKLQKI